MEVNWVGRAMEIYGPVATILLVLLVLVLVGYRRDFLIKHMLTKEERDRMTAVVERNAQASEKLAESVARLSETTRESAERYTRQIEDMIRLAEHRCPPSGRRRAR